MKKLHLTEDWSATIVGLGGIAAVTGIFALFHWTPAAAVFQWKDGNDALNILSGINLVNMGIFFVLSYLMLFVAQRLQGKPFAHTLGFPVIFLLAMLASFIGGYRPVNDIGIETVIFSLLIGLIIHHFFGLPEWLRNGLSSELFIKIGLVFLGASILFQSLLKSGVLGLIQSVVVVFAVWYFSFWLCRRCRIDKELSVMMSSAVSICGVSAAIASAGAIKGDPKKLSYVVSLVLVVAVPMIILMPFLAVLLGLNEVVAGAWIGGTIDTTGAVVATGALYGQEALETATIVKFSQNVLLGIAAFLIALFWNIAGKGQTPPDVEKTGWRVIWERFPKFVLGFILVSLIFSFFFADAGYKPVNDSLKKIQHLWFTLGFVSIGLETDFKSLFNRGNTKAGLVFIGAQIFNIAFTLLIARLVFGVEW
ncbi:MAG: YeiH family protein [Bacteroidales bacterium]|jgi:uncharacterized membrane protein YadS|nr:YeiH family protein [Bacteroidales bacterium]